MTKTAGSTITKDGTAANSKGGTEMMREKMLAKVNTPLVDQFQIICSRVRHVDPDRPTILWLHDTWDDPESQHLKDKKSLERFAKLVFVSHHQFNLYRLAYNLPYDKCRVMQNAIEPIEEHEKPQDGPIRLIYHTTPHRGLELLVPAFEALYQKWGNKIHLDVYSSFKIYGWESKDKPYEGLFQRIKDHPGMSYHGTKSNDEVREAIKKSHIFAYPNIWPETSCIAAMEAMSGGLAIVCPQHESLPETTAGFALDYPMTFNHNDHANRFAGILNQVIENYWEEGIQNQLQFQSTYANMMYNWDMRAMEWKSLLEEIASKSIR